MKTLCLTNTLKLNQYLLTALHILACNFQGAGFIYGWWSQNVIREVLSQLTSIIDLFVIAFFQSGTKKTLKPVVSEEIINDAKAKVSSKLRILSITVPYNI